MPTSIQAVVTDLGRQVILETFGQQRVFASIDEFRVGEGGWVTTPSGREPRDPTDPGPLSNRGPILTDLDATTNPADYPSDSRGTFNKSLGVGDFSVTSSGGTTTLEATCVLDFGEFNDDGEGNFPEIFEIGLFTSDGMVAYGTFPAVKKDPSVSRTFKVRIVASR